MVEQTVKSKTKCSWAALAISASLAAGCAGGSAPTYQFSAGEYDGMQDETLGLLASACTLVAPAAPALGVLRVKVRATETAYVTKTADGFILVNGVDASGVPCK